MCTKMAQNTIHFFFYFDIRNTLFFQIIKSARLNQVRVQAISMTTGREQWDKYALI